MTSVLMLERTPGGSGSNVLWQVLPLLDLFLPALGIQPSAQVSTTLG